MGPIKILKRHGMEWPYFFVDQGSMVVLEFQDPRNKEPGDYVYQEGDSQKTRSEDRCFWYMVHIRNTPDLDLTKKLEIQVDFTWNTYAEYYEEGGDGDEC